MTQADSVHSTPPINVPVAPTRRRFLSTAAGVAAGGAALALATIPPASAVAVLPAPADTANALWAERQKHVERLALASAKYDAAKAHLPAWAHGGPSRIDQYGNPCGHDSNWPLDTSVTRPPLGERITRPTIDECRETFAFNVQVFGFKGRARSVARAHMRKSIAAIVARLRERNRLYSALGLTDLDREISAACDAMLATEEAIGELEQSPNVVAATVLAGLCNDCDRTSYATGNGYCGTMAMALIALRGLLPSLSGLIRDHAAFFVSNPTLPLSAMIFSPL
jgi:hypothetical protein